MTKGYPDWMRAFLLLGKYGPSYLPVLLGPDGSLYCVLQGEYGGALRTIALDDEGRISAFVADEEDAWGQMLHIGNAELAARLGSIVRLDRRGSVMFMDNFEDGSSRWTFNSMGSNGAHQVKPARSFSGGYSLQLTAPTDDQLWMHAASIIPTCLATTVGVSVMLRTSTRYSAIGVDLDIYDGTFCHYIRAMFDYATSRINVYNAQENLEMVCSYDIDLGIWSGFHVLKFIGDIATDHYIRLLYDDHEFDITGVGVCKAPVVSVPKIYIGIDLFGTAGQPAAVTDVDDVVVTMET